MNFTQYMMDFYGPKGIYPFGFNAIQINIATDIYKSRLPADQEFYGDSIDRENVRDIILAAREVVLPEFAEN
jgi:hypothetical protein